MRRLYALIEAFTMPAYLFAAVLTLLPGTSQLYTVPYLFLARRLQAVLC